MAGKDYLVYLSDDGTDTGSDTLVEDQGDLSINPGKPLSSTSYKDGAKTAQGKEPFSARFTMGIREPLGTGQSLVFDAFDNDGSQHMTIKSATTGGIEWEGAVKLTVTEITHPVTGEPAVSVEMMENGAITRGTTGP